MKCDGNHPGREAVRGARSLKPEQCKLCWMALNPELVKANGKAQPMARSAFDARRLTIPCAHRGEPTGEIVDCPSCGQDEGKAKVRLKLLACAIHGDCTPGKEIAGHACCLSCPDYEPKTEAESEAVLITGGIGDWFAVESLLTVEERERIRTIYYATHAGRIISGLMQTKALLSFPNIRHHEILPHKGKTYYSLEEAEADHGKIAATDLSIGKVFPSARTYQGSSLLLYSLAARRRIEGEYVAVVPHSDWGSWEGRSFDAADWKACTSFLEERGLKGVILYAGKKSIPVHPLLLNLTAQTTLAESIEVLKGARGYLGIDSCMAVLASKIFPPSRFAVKSVKGHLYLWKHRYYAPRSEFGFIQRQLVAPVWESK